MLHLFFSRTRARSCVALGLEFVWESPCRGRATNKEFFTVSSASGVYN